MSQLEISVNRLNDSARLTQSEFQQMSSIVYTQCGINLEAGKKVMLESRLNKRLRTLNMPSFDSYIKYLTSAEGTEKELVHMIDVVTTNKTDFFREPHHFEYLTNSILPDHVNQTTSKSFKIWSSACSTGEEPYTLAMVLQDFARACPGFNYSIFATDISTQVLQKASNAVYNPDRVAMMPLAIKQRYLLKSKDVSNPLVRIVPALRERVTFDRVNLTENLSEVEGDFDVIFCRNVLIYFDRQTQLKVIFNLLQKLRRGGYLFIGHSESLHQFELPIRQVRPTVFVKN